MACNLFAFFWAEFYIDIADLEPPLTPPFPRFSPNDLTDSLNADCSCFPVNEGREASRSTREN